MSALTDLLNQYRAIAQTQREKGTYFEQLMVCYLRHEAAYRELYSEVWMYTDWAQFNSDFDSNDTGIDLVAQTRGTGEYHAIQCKFYASNHKIEKGDLDSFFTASGKTIFTQRIIVTTTTHWTDNAKNALTDQNPPVLLIDLHDLEASQIDWSQYQPAIAPVLKPKKELREHQQTALNAVKRGLNTAERGKLIMACGTGKTFAALKIAESIAGAGGRVLFLVPSLNLLSQTLTEWTQESAIELNSFAVCSDSDVGKKRDFNTDQVQTLVHELRYPATTNAQRLAMEMVKRHDAQHLTVVFSTYHSIAVLHDAQQNFNLPEFDLMICDEAHRTTGAVFENEAESAFVRVHDANYLRANKRLYMTATPRIYADVAKAKAEQDKVTHVDGNMNASEKEEKLQWLRDESAENTCRILSNVRCLSEGVDVPTLDAVLFLTPRNSQVDVVQSVGRVMRIAPNKKRGYVILPVVIPAGIKPHEALNDNKTYAVVRL